MGFSGLCPEPAKGQSPFGSLCVYRVVHVKLAFHIKMRNMESKLYMEECMFRAGRYWIELGTALALYVFLLFAASKIEFIFHPIGLWLLALSMVPMIGAVAMAWAILRGLHRMDELQKRIQFDAIAISFLGTALITFGWGFGESAGLPPLRAFAVWPIMGGLWGISLIFTSRKYR